VLVARQAEAGTEVLCGMTRDPDFGPILAVGQGGVAVEELDRVALSTAPLDAASAGALVAEAGVEDPHGVVARTLVALGDLGLSNPAIESVEVNPLIVGPADTVAVDALVVVVD
jgi:acetyltransferase